MQVKTPASAARHEPRRRLVSSKSQAKAYKTIFESNGPFCRVDTSKGFRPLFWYGTDGVGIQKNAEHIFIKFREDTNLGGAKAAALPLRPPPGVEAKVSIVKGSAKEG